MGFFENIKERHRTPCLPRDYELPKGKDPALVFPAQCLPRSFWVKGDAPLLELSHGNKPELGQQVFGAGITKWLLSLSLAQR